MKMERASSVQLDPANYRFSCAIPARYGDLDTQGHVNNIAMASMLEDARSQFLIATGVTTIRKGGATETLGGGLLVTAAARYEYLAQAFYPGVVSVFCATLEIGCSSILASQLAVQGAVPVAVCTCVFALTDGASSIAIGLEIRAALAGSGIKLPAA